MHRLSQDGRLALSLLGTDSWLKKPADHAVIHRWTVGGEESSHALQLPEPTDPFRFAFLVIGDSGDSETHAHGLSPQDAIAREMAAECGLLKAQPAYTSSMVLHTGDIVYMAGEKRLYDRNFRRPYSDFLTPESTVDNLVFRIPFLPVPGNHDYYDLGAWAMLLSRIPFIGDGLRALTRQLFAFSMPEGGSHMGKTYMNAFVDLGADTSNHPLPYISGERTRLPNRYYRFTRGIIDFFALDSNTLDAPPPWQDAERIRAEAHQRALELESKAHRLDRELRRLQKRCARIHEERLAVASEDLEIRISFIEPAEGVREALGTLAQALEVRTEGRGAPLESVAIDFAASGALEETSGAQAAWEDALARLKGASSPYDAHSALTDLDEASAYIGSSLRSVEAVLGRLPESPERTLLLSARDQVEAAQKSWIHAMDPLPDVFCDQIHALSEKALDVQRELALERRRARYRPDDHDSAQLTWLSSALAESVQNRPNNWRVLYLHHPIYTTIGNHCERPDVVDVRENLMAIIQDRVHVIFSGHSHAFEWFRSTRVPNMGIFVTGGGGQISLRPSALVPRRLHRFRASYDSLREAGVTECAFAGYGSPAPDGESGPLYHLLRVDVTPESIEVAPIGVRRIQNRFRREAPMPIAHALCRESRPRISPALLECVTVRRETPPELRMTRT